MPALGEFTKKTHSELTTQADLHTPKEHGPLHENGGAQEVEVTGLVGTTVFVPYNAKIADINESDTDKHTLDLATALTETRTILAIVCGALRISGDNSLYVYANEGSTENNISLHGAIGQIIMLAAGQNRLQYAQVAGNEDFDLYCYGYIVRV